MIVGGQYNRGGDPSNFSLFLSNVLLVLGLLFIYLFFENARSFILVIYSEIVRFI